MVEMSPIGYSLALCADKFYEPLSQEAKNNFIAWLGGINGKDMPDTNWLWFRVSLEWDLGSHPALTRADFVGLRQPGSPKDRSAILRSST